MSRSPKFFQAPPPPPREPEDHTCEGCGQSASFGIREPGWAALRGPMKAWLCGLCFTAYCQALKEFEDVRETEQSADAVSVDEARRAQEPHHRG